jgi:hypothetical protein
MDGGLDLAQLYITGRHVATRYPNKLDAKLDAKDSRTLGLCVVITGGSNAVHQAGKVPAGLPRIFGRQSETSPGAIPKEFAMAL